MKTLTTHNFIAMKPIRNYANAIFWSTLLSCASAQSLQPFTNDGTPPSPWRVVGLPGGKKPLTQFDVVTLGEQRVLRVRTDKSYANLTHALTPASSTPRFLRWRWRLDQPVEDADLRKKSGDDVPIKVCALFDMPTDRLGFVERNLLRLARASSGEPLPAATICYVWDQQLAVGIELANPFTRRVRYIVLDSGTSALQHWIPHTQDLRADFLRAFGDESDTVPLSWVLPLELMPITQATPAWLT
jgi:hypothetical protein